MKIALVALMLAAVVAAPAQAFDQRAADAHAADRAQIQQLVDRFKMAIIKRDGADMKAMFLPGSSWLQGLDRTSLATVRKKKPDAPQFGPGNYEKFASFVGTSPTPIEETFDNIRIETDGAIGMVWFDYTFLDNGKPTNHGNETWQVVHTDDGWKISAMLYSVILDDKH